MKLLTFGRRHNNLLTEWLLRSHEGSCKLSFSTSKLFVSAGASLGFNDLKAAHDYQITGSASYASSKERFMPPLMCSCRFDKIAIKWQFVSSPLRFFVQMEGFKDEILVSHCINPYNPSLHSHRHFFLVYDTDWWMMKLSLQFWLERGNSWPKKKTITAVTAVTAQVPEAPDWLSKGKWVNR